MILIYVFYFLILYSPIKENSSKVQMVKGYLKVSIRFKTDILAPHNAQLVISNYSYVEVFFRVPTTST